MFYIPSSPQKYKKYWGKIRKKAPKVPDLTCPAIDNILDKLEKSINNLTNSIGNIETQLNDFEERLQEAEKNSGGRF